MLPYVVETYASMEQIAAGNIAASKQTKHFTVFLPLVLVPARGGIALARRLFGSGDTRIEPLIPGYLFVIMDLLDDSWRTITSMRGVKSILGSSALSPTPIDQKKFDHFVARYESGEFSARLPQATAQARANDHVTVQSGAFADRQGICQLTRKQRAKILLPMLNGGTVETWVALDNLRVDKRPGE